MIADPYGGISWSDNATDQKWAAQPGGVAGAYLPDIDGPGYVPGLSQTIRYQIVPPDYNVAVWYPLVKNGIGILVVSGRFYSGENISSYADVLVKGLQFLSKEQRVDHSHVGIFGISLGGFEALYASGRAPANIAPQFGVAWAPPSDWEAQATYIKTTAPGAMTNVTQRQFFQNFFEPYVRRIEAITNGMPGETNSDFSKIKPASILANIKTHFLIFHDDWDILVPVAQSRSFVASMGNRAEALWFPHSTGIDYNNFFLDHQQSSEGIVSTTGFLFAQSYFLNNLLPNPTSVPLYGLYTAADISKQFTYFRKQQLAGHDISTLVPRLIELCNPQLYLIETNSGPVRTGPEYVAYVMQTYWGVSSSALNSSNVKSYLSSHGLPP